MIRDELTGIRARITAAAVINATGTYTGDLEPSVQLEYRRGTHLVVPSERLGNPRAALLISADDSLAEFVAVIPHGDGYTYIGATNVPAERGADGPTDGEIGDLLQIADSALDVRLSRDDVVGTFAALYPFARAEDGGEIDLSGKHVVTVGDTGAVSVYGGKLTTYRKMAEDAVDKAIEVAGMWAADCSTRQIPLIGADTRERLDAIDAPARLIARYGTDAATIVALMREHETLARPAVAGSPVTRAEMAFAMSHELAMTPQDVVDRRTRVGLVTSLRDDALAVAEELFTPA